MEIDSRGKECQLFKEVNSKMEEEIQKLNLFKSQFDAWDKEFQLLKETNKKLKDEMEELKAMSNHKRKRDANGEELLDKINKKEPKLDTENINILENEIIKIKRFVMTERMTKNNVNECKEKIANFRNVIKKMKMKSNNETILVRIIEEIIEKLDKTIFSSFKKVAMSEFDKFLKISTIES